MQVTEFPVIFVFFSGYNFRENFRCTWVLFPVLQSCGFFLCCLSVHEREIPDVCVNMSNQPPTGVK